MTNPLVQRIKEVASITEVAGALGLEVVRGRLRCPHPENHAHGDRTPSVSLQEDRGNFRCWVCPTVRGDVIDLVQLIRGCSFQSALQWLKHHLQISQEETPAEIPAGNRIFQSNKVVSNHKEQRNTLGSPPQIKAKLPNLREVIVDFLRRLSPVEGPAVRWLAKRRIFQPTWTRMRLRWVKDYDFLGRALLDRWGQEVLQKAGLFNEVGHLRYYKHRLILPYLDQENRAVYFQARTTEAGVLPKELNLSGAVPLPYNAPLLDGKPGLLYVCEGVMDTLTLLERNFPAVGIPGSHAFKPDWAPLFRNKQVYLAFDNDAPGRAGQERVRNLLQMAGVDAHTLHYEGKDINSIFM